VATRLQSCAVFQFQIDISEFEIKSVDLLFQFFISNQNQIRAIILYDSFENSPLRTVSEVKRNIEWQQLMQAPVAKELTDYELIRSVLRYKLTRSPKQNENVKAIFDNADAFQKTTGAVVSKTADQNTIYVDISGPALEYLKTLFEKQNYTGTWREHVKKNDFKLMRCLAKSF